MKINIEILSHSTYIYIVTIFLSYPLPYILLRFICNHAQSDVQKKKKINNTPYEQTKQILQQNEKKKKSPFHRKQRLNDKKYQTIQT